MSDPETQSSQSVSLSAVREDLQASIANMLLGRKDELMQHVEKCVAIAPQDNSVHGCCPVDEDVDTTGIHLRSAPQ